MSKPRAKIPRIRIPYNLPDFELSAQEWQGVESAYGCALHSQTRHAITLETNRFLRSVAAENTGSMSDALLRASRLRDFARATRDIIEERPTFDITRQFVDDEIALFGGKNCVRDGSDKLMEFAKACDQALQSMQEYAKNFYWQDGWSWDEWILILTQILDRQNLPTQVRKDSDKNKTGRPSPFVALVQALQTHIPKDYRRAAQLSALAQAISKARKKPRDPGPRPIRRSPACVGTNKRAAAMPKNPH
jgi:hypothetical protein